MRDRSSSLAPPMMKSRRGPTSVPMSRLNTSVAALASSIRCAAVRGAAGPWCCLCELPCVHLAEALVPLHRVLPALALALQPDQRAAQLGVGVGVNVLLLALARVGQLDPVQRRDGWLIPGQRPAWAGTTLVEQGEQQGADVRAVHVGVRHEDHRLVAGRVEVERAAQLAREPG